jgi:hypothetical protein
MCRYFDVMRIFFLQSEIWGRNWKLNEPYSSMIGAMDACTLANRLVKIRYAVQPMALLVEPMKCDIGNASSYQMCSATQLVWCASWLHCTARKLFPSLSCRRSSAACSSRCTAAVQLQPGIFKAPSPKGEWIINDTEKGWSESWRPVAPKCTIIC